MKVNRLNKGAAGAAKGRAARASLKAQARQLYRDRIIDAAEHVFVRRGLAGTRMSDVAAEAGLATGTLYNYFANRDALLSSLVEHRIDQLVAAVQAAYAAEAERGGAHCDRLLAVVRATFQHYESHRALFTVLTGGGITGKHMRRCMGAQRDYQAAFAEPLAAAVADGCLRADVPISVQAEFLTGAIHGVVRGWARQEGALNLVDQAQAVVDLFLRGAQRQS
jgi:AcrR family transcriptional regulator